MQLFINNWSSRLDSPLTSASIEMLIPAEDAARLVGIGDGGYYLLTLFAVDGAGVETSHEIIKAASATGGVVTIERGKEGTAAADWPVGTVVQARFTAGSAAAPAVALAAHAQAVNPHAQYALAADVAAELVSRVKRAALVSVAASRSISAADSGEYLRSTSAAPVTITVEPQSVVELPADAEIHLRAAGTGAVTLAAAVGVTLNPPSGGTLVLAQGMTATIKRVGSTDEWDVIGQTEAAA